MVKEIILASQSKVRKEILKKNGIKCSVQSSNVDEESVKASLSKDSKGDQRYVEDMSPELISIYLAPNNSIAMKRTRHTYPRATGPLAVSKKLVEIPLFCF